MERGGGGLVEQKCYVVATIRDEDKIIGYRLVDPYVMVKYDVPIESCEKVVHSVYNVVYDKTYKCLVSTLSNLPITDLPIIDSKDKLTRGDGGILVGQIVVDEKGKQIGAVIIETMGMVANVNMDSLHGLLKRSKAVNFEMRQYRGDYQIVSIGGEPIITRPLDKYVRSSYRESDDPRCEYGKYELPKVPVYSVRNVTSSSFNKNCNEAMFTAIRGLKVIAPYYWVLLQTIDKRPCSEDVTPTMGVTEDRMYYNPSYVVSCSVEEVRFVLIHEVMHIAMMHAARKGKRDHQLWNIATDLYINEMLVHDFGLTPGEITYIGSQSQNLGIQPPVGGLYFSKIDEVCNLSKDTPEMIYQRLYEENKDKLNMPGNMQGMGNSQGSGDDSQGSGSGQGGGSGSTQSGSGSGTSGEGGKEQESGGSGQGGVTITYNGKPLMGRSFDEIMSNTGRGSDDDKEESDNQSRQKLQDMKTKKKMVEDKTGVELTKGMSGAELVQRMIEFSLSRTLDWRLVMKRIILEKPKKKYTLASPNEAYMNMGVTLADRRRIGKPEKVKNIKICIDTSGSVSTEKLNYFLGEVANMFTTYDCDGELLYWNTSVCDSGYFSKRQDLQKVNSNWSGGTDVKCVFDWLVGKEKSVTGKVNKTKVKDIKAVIIITDGCFDRNYEEYAEYFGSKTLWLIDGMGAYFDPCFGRVLELKGKEEE